MMMACRFRVSLRRCGAALVAATVAFAGGSATAARVGTTPPSIPPASAPGTVTADAIRGAKVGWSRFVADNFAVPTAVPDPCPLLTVEAANAGVSALGLVSSELPYGVSLYRDATGVGIISIACGADLAKAAIPSGSTSFVVEVTLLDGQAVFPQYVVRIAGNDTPISSSPELGGDVIGRCRNDPQYCVASWHADGLVITVKLDGPRTNESEAQARQLLLGVVPQVLVNLAAVAPAL